MCAAQHIQPDCHFAFSSYHDQFSLQSGKRTFDDFHGITRSQGVLQISTVSGL